MRKWFFCTVILLLTITMLPLHAQAEKNISTRQELITYLTRQTAFQPSEITFSYTSSLKNNIATQSWMSEVLNEAGIFSASWRYGSGSCTLKNIQYMPAHVLCSTEAEIISALQGARNGAVNFRVPAELYNRLKANNFEHLHKLEGQAGLKNRQMSYYNESRLFLYTDIEFARNLSTVSTSSALEKLMKNHQAQNLSSFTIICTPELFGQLNRNDFAALHLIEGKAGIMDRKMTYYSSKYMIEYTEVEYALSFASVKTLDEFKRCMENKCLALESDFTIQCTQELFTQLTRQKFALLHAIENNLGIYQRSMHYNDSKLTITYSDIEYYPGYYVARSIHLGRTRQLTGRMKQLYNEAQLILREINAVGYPDSVARQYALQNAITSRVTYYKEDASGDHDTAIGALLNGRSECDGYADAFYLLADMAGFDVRFQYGDDFNKNDDETHLWNAISHNGKWYFTDLTWCDTTDDSMQLYTNIGQDIARTAYDWDPQAALVPLASATDSRLYFYTREGLLFNDAADAGAFVTEQLRNGNTRVEILLQKDSTKSESALIDAFGDALNYRCRYIYKHTGNWFAFIIYPRN